ncbi:MAG: hypothetical protein JXL97_03750 [Bacteroidales bacterium]|nr:hypothetical protein [Bacteroidales bacterium]
MGLFNIIGALNGTGNNYFGRFRIIIVLFAIVQFVIIGFYNLFRSFVAKDFIEIGFLKFTEDGLIIKLDNKDFVKYNFEDISSFMIKYNGYAGQQAIYYQSVASSDGAYNEITFNHFDTKHNYLFFIKNKFEERWRRNYIKFLLKENIDIVFEDSYSISNYFGIPTFRKRRKRNNNI